MGIYAILASIIIFLLGLCAGMLIKEYMTEAKEDGVITVDLENESIAALEIYTPIDEIVSNNKIMLTVKKLEQK